MKIAITNEIVLPNAAEIENELKAFNWSPCGRYLLAGSAAKMIKLWDVEEEEQIHCIEGLDYWPTSSTWSPDGSKFAVGFYQDNDDYNVKVFNTDSGECIQTLHKHSGNMFDVCWTNDNNLGGAEFLWSGSGKDALAMMWEPLSGQAAFEQQHPNEIRRLIPSADHSRLLVGCWPQSI
ncbi:MAG: WD40 repeat protein, partial [Phenylobacterium sp.]